MAVKPEILMIVNLDDAMMNFLKFYFPEEVRAKQKAVERALLEELDIYTHFQYNIT